ncbi:helix-turn-helix domain-containing protein [Azospirillum agricola]|uniref:helix-turn-helix domain-containing protein n=1 Tax=Azospirillum agricola TaxID=1720247 RepID=UPI000A0F07A1|nr:helix-turn-helix domain-containing protein [Azospirillum agricola]SMH55660.1 transcriptional regulator, XRE family with cupin sensor [Azospirillum lipoferum]
MDDNSIIIENTGSTIDARLAARLRGLRGERNLTLDGLAARAGVSRSMISLIERGQSSPTASVLERLAAGLGVTLASLFAEEERPDAPPVARRADQTVWRDPESGYRRRNLSPPGFPSPIELVEVVLPPGTRVAYDSAWRAAAVHQQLFILEGEITLTVGDDTHRLAAGDCLAMRLDRPTRFHNPATVPARYLVALTTEAAPAGQGDAKRRGVPP